MPYDKLLSEGLIKKQAADSDAILELVAIAERDARVAQQVLEVDPDWSFNIAYNSTQQASRALMLSKGYRPRRPNQHLTVVLFLKEIPALELADEIRQFDQMRRKRHRAVYDAAGQIGASEAEQAVSFARTYLENVRQSV